MVKHRRTRSGSITLNQDVDVDVYIDDIIDHLDSFGTEELRNLRDAINDEIGEDTTDNTFGVTNLEEEQKVKILKEMFDKFTWEELEKINKSL